MVTKTISALGNLFLSSIEKSIPFIDLLKYQISLKKTIDQLFFVTCDGRISRLIKYKMNGRGIALKELSEIERPKDTIELNSIPRTAAGKIDKKLIKKQYLDNLLTSNTKSK